jgi:hypothetical protein
MNMKHLIYFFSILTLVISNSYAAKDQSAYKVSDRYEKLNSSDIPDWESLEVMQQRFEEIRDSRFVIYEEKNILRGIPFLYPDDGCHTRAAMLIQQAVEKSYAKPKKVFIFGELIFKTPYSMIEEGQVRWWFHAAPIVKVAGQVYVLDPAVNFDSPLKIKDWALKLTPNFDKVNFAYCDGSTYKSTDSCQSPKSIDQEELNKEIQFWLKMEWNRHRNLGNDPWELFG